MLASVALSELVACVLNGGFEFLLADKAGSYQPDPFLSLPVFNSMKGHGDDLHKGL